MDWTPDFCLSCDRQIPGGVYCSQSCRLADLERASTGSEPASPLQFTSTTSSFSSPPRSKGLHLPPRLNFDAYRSKSSAQASPSTTSPTTNQPSKSTVLQSFSSTTSLSSMGSSSTQAQEVGYLSEQAKAELRDYSSSFDRVRDWKRRITWS
ncbi:MAG: hypothetical protein M1814_000329 [Vezdaea aestivalis]|nr:MAG: hypothetical protein M1814_000329 [Vezdaea aestivalis]